ncbi:DeoR/GlpR transcriptional regulator [Anoxybacterium hadale]|uniref:DeoR/GlpR transcriptional regulator n=1 Tax=Anoxybacterium hadale TaxID=3408580 RepID=A0ACD1AH84_9FIRM|nr:DeoR/GlpR transcriptional regulator [Clostridiales bacterium]
MFKVERKRKIKEIIFNRKQVDVATLSKLLNVTEATIRNDFDELEEEGFITRFHGGASLNSAIAQEEDVNSALTGNNIQYDKAKEALGIFASSLISNEEWIFLGPGSTSYYIAKALVSRNDMKIFTNNLLVSNVLSNNSTIQIHFLGGRLDNKGLYTIPNDIQKDLNNIYISKCFFSVDGADIDAGYTLSDTNVLEIIKAVSARCQQPFFAIDDAKFGYRAFMKVGDLDAVPNIIINDNVPDFYKQYYLEHGICVYTA